MHADRFRGRVVALVGLAVVSILTSHVGGTTASFTAVARNDAAGFSIDALVAPSDLTATVVGNGIDLAWTPGAFAGSGDAAGQRIAAELLGVEAGTRIGAPLECDESDAFATSITRAPAGTSSYSDGITAIDAGGWRCYRVTSEYPATPAVSGFHSEGQNPMIAVQLGHVVRSVTLVDGGTPGDLRPGDAFVFAFNQPVDSATGPVSTSGSPKPKAGNDICIHSNSGAIVIGRDESLLNANCAANNAHRTGKLATVSMLPSGQRNAYEATYTWSDCLPSDPALCSTMTATIGDRYRGNTDVSIDADGAALTPNVLTGALLAADGTPLCFAANNGRHTCRPTVTGSL
jgi:hypothetical protein